MSHPHNQIAVVGGASCDRQTGTVAFEVGQGLARGGATVLCGGRGGVMERAAEGARAEGGMVVGILPGASPRESPPNPHLSLEIFTGMGQARNQILVLSSASVIAIDGGWGTLSEIALALKHRIPVVRLGGWRLAHTGGPQPVTDPLLFDADSPAAAVETALAAARNRTREESPDSEPENIDG